LLTLNFEGQQREELAGSKRQLPPLTTGRNLAVQFSSSGDLSAGIHIARNVPEAAQSSSNLVACKKSSLLR
jgi:hypothetical protein